MVSVILIIREHILSHVFESIHFDDFLVRGADTVLSNAKMADFLKKYILLPSFGGSHNNQYYQSQRRF